MSATVTLRSKVGPFSTRAYLPNGKIFAFHFKEKVKGDGQFVAEVPTVVTFVDDFNKTHPYHDNYAEFLLHSYDHLELVSVQEEPTVKEPVVRERPVKHGPKPRKVDL
jgi:hypothetical protein